jgi:membrane-associated phospholipid phosphatase
MALFQIFPVEEQLITALQANPSALLDIFFKAMTLLGNPALWFFIAAVLFWEGKERQSFFLVNTIVFASAATAALKVFFARPRPDALTHRVLPEDWISKMLENGTPEFGFPSGHSTIIASVLAFFSKNKKALTLFFFGIVAVLVAVSRIYLGKHYLLDVVAGLGLGTVIGIFVLWIDKAFEKHKFHLSKLEDEAIVILLIAIAVIAVALLDVPVLAASVFGYYTGFFLGKEAELKQTTVHGKKMAIKLAAGIISAGIMLLLTISLYEINRTLALFFFFTNAFWISYGYPDFFEKAMQSIKKFPAIEKILK